MSEKLILGTHHISLKPCGAEAYAKTVDFYQNLLELTPVRVWENGDVSGIMLSTGNSIMEITSNGTDEEKRDGSINHFAFTTDKVDILIDKVRKAGYEITLEPFDATIPTEPPYAIRVAFCRGPVGESIEFFYEK